MGIFDDKVNLYTSFNATIRFRDRLVGGHPKDPKAMREAIVRRMGITSEESLRREFRRLLIETGVNPFEMSPDATLEQLEEYADKIAERSANGFKFDENGLFIEAYQVKASFRESTNIAFAGEKWGRTKKGAKNYLAERVFIEPGRIYLGRTEPDGILTKYGVVNGPQGPRSIVTQAEYVERAELSFIVRIAKERDGKGLQPDSEILSRIDEIWVRMQDNGLGAMRSSDFGRFDLIRWEGVEGAQRLARVA